MILVYDYDTGEPIPGAPTPELVEASLAAMPTGAVNAYFEGGLWHYVPASQVDLHDRFLNHKVRMVYIED